ncbi:MAG TPA: acyltransferase family protein, partial [Pseudonocardiaceae bacterium]|nr:acyltransferase family protein [Pseudonocardiaceae bacterium]
MHPADSSGWARLRDAADATPPGRDRVVDAARAAAILVVITWHWAGSVTHRDPGGTLVMPNPIAAVPGGWLATWVLQVMPVFFVVGGFANFTAWSSVLRRGGGAAEFLRRRMARLLLPVAVWAAAWLTAELVVAATLSGHRWVWEWFPGVLTPLWFVVAYTAVTAATPLTAWWHRRVGGAAMLGMGAGIVVLDVLARGVGVGWAGWMSAGLVWLFAHQLGYLWHTAGAAMGTGRRAGLAVAGLAGLVLLTVLGYPRSMVALPGDTESNMFPPNATIAALATLQLGLILLAAPRLNGLLHRRGVWRAVVAVNAVIMTLFVWHMTAYAGFLWLFESLGGRLTEEPTIGWWRQRPLWLLG